MDSTCRRTLFDALGRVEAENCEITPDNFRQCWGPPLNAAPSVRGAQPGMIPSSFGHAFGHRLDTPATLTVDAELDCLILALAGANH